jgi:hypothetical protein
VRSTCHVGSSRKQVMHEIPNSHCKDCMPSGRAMPYL